MTKSSHHRLSLVQKMFPSFLLLWLVQLTLVSQDLIAALDVPPLPQ